MKNKIINFLIYGFGQSINILSPLLVVPYIISICNEEGLGKIGISFSISLILCCVIDYSSTLLGTKEISIHRNDKIKVKNSISKFFLAKCIITIVLVISFILGTFTIPFLRSEQNLYLLIVPLLLAQLFNPNWILQGLEKFKVVALFNILSKSVYLFLVFICIKEKEDYIWVNFYLGCSSLLFYSIAIFSLFRVYDIKLKSFSFTVSYKLLKKDFKICISEFCLSIYQFFPIIIVGYFLGNSAAGIYKIIEQIISVFRTYIFMFFTFSYPIICYDMEKEKEKGFKVWMSYNFINTIIIGIGGIFIYGIKDFVFDFFKVSEELIPTMNSLLILGLIIPFTISVSQALRQLIFVSNLLKQYTLIIYISTALNLLAMYIFLNYFDIKGVFYAALLIEILVIISYIYAYKIYHKTNYEN